MGYQVLCRDSSNKLEIIIEDKELLDLIDLLSKKWKQKSRVEMLIFGLKALIVIDDTNKTLNDSLNDCRSHIMGNSGKCINCNF
jgi:hypothetical protein